MPVLARQRPAPVVGTTRIRTVEERSELRVEVSVNDPDIVTARRDAQLNAQVALYEFVNSGNASARTGTRLDVFA